MSDLGQQYWVWVSGEGPLGAERLQVLLDAMDTTERMAVYKVTTTILIIRNHTRYYAQSPRRISEWPDMQRDGT